MIELLKYSEVVYIQNISSNDNVRGAIANLVSFHMFRTNYEVLVRYSKGNYDYLGFTLNGRGIIFSFMTEAQTIRNSIKNELE